MKRKNLLNKKGFTLIELIVVIAILAILALILVPSITGYISKANEAKNLANARTIASEVALNDATTDGYLLSSYTLPTGCTFEPATATTYAGLTGITCGTGASQDNPQTVTLP